MFFVSFFFVLACENSLFWSLLLCCLEKRLDLSFCCLFWILWRFLEFIRILL